MDEPDLEARKRQRIEMRLPLVEAFLWAAEHSLELLSVVSSERTLADCRRALTEEPYCFTEWQAIHLLDLPIRNLSPERIAEFREEAAGLRRGEYREPVAPSPSRVNVVRRDPTP